MKHELKLIFPCGYEIQSNMVFNMFVKGNFYFDEQNLPICPIHKNKCRGQK